MSNKQMKLTDKLLRAVHIIGEHYWAVLLTGVAIGVSAMTYGYFFNQHDVLRWAIYATLVFVFGPPAVLMSSFLIASLFSKINKN